MTLHVSVIARELSLDPDRVARTLELLDGGATVPFVARYRKEATGNLDEDPATEIAMIADGRAHGFVRASNRAGGIEGGMSNGEPIVVRVALKPIPTLGKPLRTVDILTGRGAEASSERSDVCAVASAAIVAESAVAFEIARAYREKFGGDSIAEMARNYESYVSSLRSFIP